MESRERGQGSNGPFQVVEWDSEQMSLLADDDQDNSWMDEQPCPPNPHSHLPVYTTIHR